MQSQHRRRLIVKMFHTSPRYVSLFISVSRDSPITGNKRLSPRGQGCFTYTSHKHKWAFKYSVVEYKSTFTLLYFTISTIVPHSSPQFTGVEQDIDNWWGKKQSGAKHPKNFCSCPNNPVCPLTYWEHMTFLPLPFCLHYQPKN